MPDLFEICTGPDLDTDAPEQQHIPLIGDAAPEFVAQTTNGTINFPSDYAGRWVILFSHPSDFTPVCTSEFMAFQSMMNQFKQQNVALIGLSVGTLTSHLAWISAIKDIKYNGWENMEIEFPVIDDISMKVAKKYGMIHANAMATKAVRAVFVIDPAGIIRAIIYYPASTGRNFNEIWRLVTALQTTDAFGVSTPANWVPGDDVLVGAPDTTNKMWDVEKSKDSEFDSRAWFFTFKKLSKEKILEKLMRNNGTKSRSTQQKKK